MSSFNSNSAFTDHWNVEVDEFEYEIHYYSKMCCPCIQVKEIANFYKCKEGPFTLAMVMGHKNSSDAGTHAFAYYKGTKLKTFLDANCDLTQICICFKLCCTNKYLF